MNRFPKIVLTVLLLAAAMPCGADDDVSLAKAKIEDGRALIAKEDYAGALEAFQASYALRPKPWVMFNIAMCQKALHRYVDAIASFHLFIRTEQNPSAATLTLAEEAIGELEQMVGKVHLVEAPDGAAVSVDGTRVATTPLSEPLVLDPGRHVVNISKDKFKTLNVEVIVASGAEIEVRADLEHPRAEIKVDCRGERTVVFVDDTAVGSCPYKGEVGTGVHELKVIEPGKQTFTQTIEATAGATLVIPVEDLKPIIALNPPTFINEPAGAEVSKRNWGMKVGGITALGLGVVSFGLGGLFTAKWNRARRSVEDAVEEVNEANQPWNQSGYDDAYSDYLTERNKAEGYRNAMVSSYAIGGGLLAIGATLFIWNMALEKHEAAETPVAFRVVPGGVAGTF